ncbi:uncharacterized protein G2W53_008390 [Senna tora]|uniref:Uncharacterized protein n=1 Tax=Senna tora TaxID=362788 RepID=A0A834XA30_9FABA|nr:uncharacterized protein G2W53_008390 [Senna tora]
MGDKRRNGHIMRKLCKQIRGSFEFEMHVEKGHHRDIRSFLEAYMSKMYERRDVRILHRDI